MKEFNIGYPHSQTPRVLLEGARTIQNKIAAWGLDQEYYDGARNSGYGGFRYDGRWAKIVPNIIKEYGLNAQSAVLDIGSKKGFFMHDLKKALPEIKLKLNEINKGVNLLDFLSKNKIMTSKSEARRAIINKGLKINNEVINDANKILQLKDFKENILKISYGKKKHYLIKII